jgi:hypothetical protein
VTREITVIKFVAKAAAVGVVAYAAFEVLRRLDVGERVVSHGQVAVGKLLDAWPFVPADDPTEDQNPMVTAPYEPFK